MNSALTAWAGLLDRWIEENVTADARTFDRLGTNRLADLWVDNVDPFVAAAITRPRRRQNQYAEGGLSWLAKSSSGRRRTWVIEQSALAGRSLDLRQPPPDTGISRDVHGNVQTFRVPLSPITGAELSTDYDLSKVKVDKLLVERSNRVLRASAQLTGLLRRFDSPFSETALVKADLQLEELAEAAFDADDVPGLVVSAEDDGISFAFGEHSILRAARGTLWIQDSAWHLSTAGRAADAATPVIGPPPLEAPERGVLKGEARVVAQLLNGAMLELRGVYAPVHLDPPPTELCKAFAGAGKDVLSVGA
jgi:hypothetical protein